MRDRTKNTADVLIGAEDRMADEDREREAKVLAAAVALAAVDEHELHAALFACSGDDDTALLDASPAMQGISAAMRDVSRVRVLDEKLRRNMKRYLKAETEWAVSRVAGLPFSSADVCFAFLLQAVTEERQDLLPLSVTTTARLSMIAASIYYADVARQMGEERRAS